MCCRYIKTQRQYARHRILKQLLSESDPEVNSHHLHILAILPGLQNPILVSLDKLGHRANDVCV